MDNLNIINQLNKKDPSFILHAKDGCFMARSHGDPILIYNGLYEVAITLNHINKNAKIEWHYIHAINEVFAEAKKRSFIFGCYMGLVKYKKYYPNELKRYIQKQGWDLNKEGIFEYVTIQLPFNEGIYKFN